MTKKRPKKDLREIVKIKDQDQGRFLIQQILLLLILILILILILMMID